MLREVQITFDCVDPAALAAFWAAALGYQEQPPPPGFDSWDAFLDSVGVPPEERNSRSAALPVDGNGPRLFFQRVPEGKTAKNRVHLDVRAAPGLEGDARMSALEAEADRLLSLGASRLRRSAAPVNASYCCSRPCTTSCTAVEPAICSSTAAATFSASWCSWPTGSASPVAAVTCSSRAAEAAG